MALAALFPPPLATTPALPALPLSGARCMPDVVPFARSGVMNHRGWLPMAALGGAVGLAQSVGAPLRARRRSHRWRRPWRLVRKFFNFGGEAKVDNKVGLVYDSKMAKHRNLEDASHPEQPLRVLKVYEHLEKQGLVSRCVPISSREATQEELLLKHTKEHVDAILGLKDMSEADVVKMGADFDSIFLCPESTEAALLSAGCVLEATERVCSGEVQSACCVVRPPGHHAEESIPRGFCLFGNVALAAAMAKQRGLASKILIVDFDVHHGNGTQKMFEDDSSVLFCSVHRYDRGKYYPGGQLGNYTSHGVDAGEGYTVNIPWEVAGNERSPPGDAEMLYAFDRVFLPIAREFSPDLVLVSAGFDAAPGDPLGGCRVSPSGFYRITKQLMGLADGKVVLAQEGRYNVESNSESMAACAQALLGDDEPEGSQLLGFNVVDERDAQPAAVCHVSTVETARKHYAQWWECLRPQIP